MSAVIIGYNQPTYIKKMVNQLEKYTNDIIIIDNCSTYTPLLEYYKEYKYTLLRQNKNYGHEVYKNIFMDKVVGPIYILTDPDIEFNKNLPNNFIEELVNISNYYQAERVGFALLYNTNDIRNECIHQGKSITNLESVNWIYKFLYKDYEIYSGKIETTTCLINRNNKGDHYRIAGNYTCKHKPWHKNFEKEMPYEEYYNYLNNNISTIYWKIK
jgi:hypothetical protein